MLQTDSLTVIYYFLILILKQFTNITVFFPYRDTGEFGLGLVVELKTIVLMWDLGLQV